MATITELSLFKICVDNHKVSSPENFNLDNISDPTNVDLTEQEKLQKKALKLYHMAWSGITKYIRQTVATSNRSIELPGFAIFIPVATASGEAQRLTSKLLSQMGEKQTDVSILISQNFLNQCGDSLNVPNNEKISVYEERPPISNLAQINFGSVAKVCDTDQATIEMIYQEMLVQLSSAAKRNDKIRLAFKVGRLVSRNGQLDWKSYKDDAERVFDKTKDFTSQTSSFAQSRYSKRGSEAMVNSVHKRDLSVTTPKCISIRSKGRSSQSQSFHMANPNPQNVGTRFKGVRESGYKHFYENQDPLQEVIRFGRRVNYDQKVTSEEVMQTHLKQMREKLHKTQTFKGAKQRNETEFLQQIHNLERLERQRRDNSLKTMNQQFLNSNGQIVAEKQNQKDLAKEMRMSEKYQFFPFVHGEMVEQGRAKLANQLKSDLQSYINYTASQSGASQQGTPLKSRHEGSDTKSLTSVTGRRKVKALFDSAYVKPEHNYRVIQDHNPVKQQIIADALTRYEQDLAVKNQLHDRAMTHHKDKIARDYEKIEQENIAKRQKQSRFKATIDEQVNENQEMRHRNYVQERLPLKTSFGPENGHNENTALQKKKLEQQKIMKEILDDQIGEKNQNRDKSRQLTMERDESERQENKHYLKSQQQISEQTKMQNSIHWENQLKQSKDLKNRLPYKNDIITKQYYTDHAI